MKATDFDLSKDLKFDLQTGMTTFKNNRMIVLDTSSMGLLRQKLSQLLGWEKTRALFLKFGYQNGYADFMQMKLAHQFDSEVDLFASGPVIHTWEGYGLATPREIRFDRSTGDFLCTGRWTNSYEAEQFLCFNQPANEPVCWSMVGYASGWSTAFFGRRLVAIEPVCVGKGDDHCEWKVVPEAEWGEEAAPYVEAYKEFPV
jgi:hypothetical protein